MASCIDSLDSVTSGWDFGLGVAGATAAAVQGAGRPRGPRRAAGSPTGPSSIRTSPPASGRSLLPPPYAAIPGWRKDAGGPPEDGTGEVRPPHPGTPRRFPHLSPFALPRHQLRSLLQPAFHNLGAGIAGLLVSKMTDTWAPLSRFGTLAPAGVPQGCYRGPRAGHRIQGLPRTFLPRLCALQSAAVKKGGRGWVLRPCHSHTSRSTAVFFIKCLEFHGLGTTAS